MVGSRFNGTYEIMSYSEIHFNDLLAFGIGLMVFSIMLLVQFNELTFYLKETITGWVAMVLGNVFFIGMFLGVGYIIFNTMLLKF